MQQRYCIARAVLAGLIGASSMVFAAAPNPVPERVEALLRQMTLEEKVGQLTQYSGQWQLTGPVSFKGNAEAASWDLAAIERSARIAATEAAASRIHWTFAPMVDVARDPRWGRVMEGAGEDTYLGSLIATARVKGFQGKKLGDTDAVMATAKHFAGYGAAVGGRDYNSVDMSERMLWETYLPPFKAALDAGAASFMNAFNDLNGVPSTGNNTLLRDILKGKWGFDGFVVSDWDSIGEMVVHGYAKDLRQAALMALTAGSDIEMQSNAYRAHLAPLIADGQLEVALLDDAVRRVLRKKFELGLFDDPYRFSDAAREQGTLGLPGHRQAARDMAAKSIVLLKNQGDLLPLSKALKSIAFIGPMVKAHKDNHGAWAVNLPNVDYSKFIVSQWDGLKNRLGPQTQLLYARGCGINDDQRDGFAEALAVAEQADLVIVSVGEGANMSGEAKSRASLRLPGVQEDLVRALHATGKPLVVLINAGRPLVFNWIADQVPAILYTWWLGSEAGNAIADVLLGDVNPSAKLPMTFPRSEGQIPIYYNSFNTGRPSLGGAASGYVSGYIDLDGAPRFPFGFGLSYTRFDYSNLVLDRRRLRGSEQITISMTLKNAGLRAGEEIVQLYMRDQVASVVRPVRELKDFRKLILQPGESKTLRFVVDREKLSFYNQRLRWVAEPGDFDVMIGASSTDIRLRDQFELTP